MSMGCEGIVKIGELCETAHICGFKNMLPIKDSGHSRSRFKKSTQE